MGAMNNTSSYKNSINQNMLQVTFREKIKGILETQKLTNL